MKKWLLLAVACLGAPAAMGFDPLGVYKIRPPEGCVEKDVTQEALSLADLIQVSICTNPALSAQYIGVKVSEADLGTARAEYLPSIDLTGEGTIDGERKEKHSYSQDEPYKGNAALSWLLFDFGGRSARVARTRSYLDQANFTYDASLQELVLSVQSAYLNLLAAQESLASAQASLDTYKQSYTEAEKRYKLGMVSLNDKLQARTKYEQAMLSVIKAENSVKNYGGALAILINLSPDTPITLSKPVFEEKFIQLEDDNVEDLMRIAWDQRPEVQAQHSAVEASKANLRDAKTELLPSISATASASYEDNWKHSNPYMVNNAAGLKVSWPLFSGFSNTYKVQQASYQHKQAQIQTQHLKRQVENQVWSSYQNYKTSLRAYEISQTVLESAEENERVAFRYYEVGKGDILNLLTAVSMLAEARQNKITAFYDVLLSKANLYRSIGRY